MAPESKSEGPVSPETSRTPQACLPKLAEFSGCCTPSHPIVKPLPPRGSPPFLAGLSPTMLTPDAQSCLC